ncbi:hypothetical protein LZ318_26480 [Saccharopolyspora indica]|uniref:hypothetical protein n=1 Tax=Saccharopolyspora indica TaxID=1229659 RepID=UPI0022EAFA11|nr:hypothetical protein [Saccharopolyspora indica]MDA3648994.1 hypothetical protein [Saccharopolyspora indica]
MRKTNRLAVLIPGGLLAAALVVSGCASLAEQSVSPGTAAGVASVQTGEEALDIAVDVEFIENDGGFTVSYAEGKWDDSTGGAPRPIHAGGPTLTAPLSPEAQLFSPFAGGTPTAEPQVDDEGLGVVPISAADFTQQNPQSAKIWFDDSGRITKIAARYQP